MCDYSKFVQNVILSYQRTSSARPAAMTWIIKIEVKDKEALNYVVSFLPMHREEIIDVEYEELEDD